MKSGVDIVDLSIEDGCSKVVEVEVEVSGWIDEVADGEVVMIDGICFEVDLLLILLIVVDL